MEFGSIEYSGKKVRDEMIGMDMLIEGKMMR